MADLGWCATRAREAGRRPYHQPVSPVHCADAFDFMQKPPVFRPDRKTCFQRNLLVKILLFVFKNPDFVFRKYLIFKQSLRPLPFVSAISNY